MARFENLPNRPCKSAKHQSRSTKVAFLCAEHFYFHEQHLFPCVNPLLLCYRVLNMGRVAFVFRRFLVIFTSWIENLTRGTATLQNEIFTVLRFHNSL